MVAGVDGSGRSPLLTAALEYAESGVPVFPCVPLAKAPLTPRGFKDATTDPAQLVRWWRWQPDANIGLVTGAGRSTIDILDIDVHPGGDGFDALHAAEEAGLISSWSRIIRSPSGGIHVVFPANSDSRQRSWAVPSAHVDFLADGSYVLAPPSRVRTRDGGIAEYKLIATGRAPASVRGWRLEKLLRPARTEHLESTSTVAHTGQGKQPRWEAGRLADWVAGRPEGNRNRSLFWAACRLMESGQVSAQSWALLADGGVRAGLNELEAVRTIQSAQRSARPGNGPPHTSVLSSDRRMQL